MIFLAVGISGYAVYQFLTHSNQVWNFISPYQGRASGTYISPNNLAGFLEMLLPLAIAYTLVGRVKPLVRVLLIYATVIMVAGMVVTFSRGGWVAVAVGLLSLLGILACHRNHRLPALLLLIIFLAGGTIFTTEYLTTTFSYIHRMEKVGAVKELDWDIRCDIPKGRRADVAGSCVVGRRAGSLRLSFPGIPSGRPARAAGPVHNDYLNLLADWGAVGGVIVLAGMVTFAAGLSKTWKRMCGRRRMSLAGAQATGSLFSLAHQPDVSRWRCIR